MGNQYFKSIFYQHRGEKLAKPTKKDLEISSERLGEIFRDTSLQITINTCAGIFYYETDTWDIEELKKQLHKLVDEIGAAAKK